MGSKDTTTLSLLDYAPSPVVERVVDDEGPSMPSVDYGRLAEQGFELPASVLELEVEACPIQCVECTGACEVSPQLRAQTERSQGLQQLARQTAVRRKEQHSLAGPLLLLIDAPNMAISHWHSQGQTPHHESFGYALQRLRKRLRPSFAIAVWDGPGKTWRHDLEPAYKAHRAEREPELEGHLARCVDECTNAHLRCVAVPGIEADDLIASYAAEALRRGIAVVVVSRDKDLKALVRDEHPCLWVWDPVAGRELWWEEDVRAKFRDVAPAQIPHVLALAGDKSDGYAGVPGIGLVNAARLIREHGSVERLLERVALVDKPAIKRALKEHADQARHCLKLAQLKADVPLPVPLEHARW